MINMQKLIENINENKEWRENELTQLKKILIDASVNERNFKVLSKYSQPAICAIWEGFFKEVIGFYYSFINRNGEINGNLDIITNIIEHNKIIKNVPPKGFEDKKKLIKDIKEVLNNPSFNETKPEIGAKNLNDTNKILKKLQLDQLDNKHKGHLNQLVKNRNEVAHGDNLDKFPNIDCILHYIKLINDLMNELTDIIIKKLDQFDEECSDSE